MEFKNALPRTRVSLNTKVHPLGCLRIGLLNELPVLTLYYRYNIKHSNQIDLIKPLNC